MSSEVFGRWLTIGVKIYVVYFVTVFIGLGIVIIIYALIETWRERKRGDKNDGEGSL